MNKEEITARVESLFKLIEKSFHKMTDHYNSENISAFRTNVKALRSFLHLFDMAGSPFAQHKITTRMKTIYGYAGIIQSLYEIEAEAPRLCRELHEKAVVPFTGRIKKELDYWKREMLDFTGPDLDFTMDRDQVLEQLPASLRTTAIIKLIKYIVFEFEAVSMNFHDDEDLHIVRKWMEDILYNWDILGKAADYLPRSISARADVENLVNELFQFRQVCAAVALLHQYAEESSIPEEKDLLESLLTISKKEKEKQFSGVVAALRTAFNHPVHADKTPAGK